MLTLAGARALSTAPIARNVFIVRLRRSDQAARTRLQERFPGVVLPAIAPPEMRDLQGVSGLPLALAALLMLLVISIMAHALISSVRRRGRELAILKAVGFTPRQVRATVAWQATALAGTGLIIGVPLGLAAGRLAWALLAGQFGIEPVPVVPWLVLLAVPALILLANVVAASPARTAARVQPATLLRVE